MPSFTNTGVVKNISLPTLPPLPDPVMTLAVNSVLDLPTESQDTLVRQTVQYEIMQFQLSNQDKLLERIAWCESRNHPDAKNASSTASGRFQFLKSSWAYYGKQLWGDDWVKKDVFDWNDNTELAVYVFKKNGSKDWLPSKNCWSK